MMSLRYLKLFSVYRFVILEVNYVLLVSGQSQVVLVKADCFLMLEQNIDVSLSESVRYLQITLPGNLISG
jgi:hypothetical protein